MKDTFNILNMKSTALALLFLIQVGVSAQENYDRSVPSSFAWKTVGLPDLSEGEVYYPVLAFSQIGELYVAYCDVNFQGAMTVKKHNGNYWIPIGSWGSIQRAVAFISLTFSPSGEPYLSFAEGTQDYFYKISVMKLNGINWEYVGSPGFSDSNVGYTSLTFDSTGQLYVAYVDDWENTFIGMVKKFNGTEWINVGLSGFSNGWVDCTDLAISPSGQPYVAFKDLGNSAGASVKKFNGTEWVYIGNPSFSSASAENLCIAFSTEGQPYVAFKDYGNGGNATVMKFNGTDWINIGAPGFTEGMADYIDFSFSPTGEPTISFIGNSQRASVMKFDGTNWVYVGNSGFSSRGVEYTSLAFNQYASPYVAFKDYENNHGATVMKFDSVFVGINDLNFNHQIILYPNPASIDLSVELNKDLHGDKCIEVTDIRGKIIFGTHTCDQNIKLNIGNYPSGMYFIKVKTAESVDIEKFFKN
jgi:hypothetical protein